MRGVLVFTLVGLLSSCLSHCKVHDVHFIRMEKMNETNDLFEYDLKSVEKLNQTSFKANFESNLKVDLTEEHHFWINVFHNKDGKEEFGEKPMISLPKRDICDFVNSTYRVHIWEKVKDFSNFPEPGTCPIKAGQYYLKDYVHNSDRFKSLMRPGMMRIEMFISQDHGESHITKNGVRIFARVDDIPE